MMSRRTGLFLLIVTLATFGGCATAPPKRVSAPAPPMSRPQPLAVFATRPDGDPVYECIRSALQTQDGLVALKSGQSSDDKVSKALVGQLQESPLRRQREAEGALWAQTRDPATVARAHLQWCVGSTGVAIEWPSTTLDCLQFVEPADLFSIAHSVGRSREAALEAARARYRGFLTDDQLTSLSEQVWALAGEDAQVRFRATRFGQCLTARQG